jgi:hypothetical protein
VGSVVVVEQIDNVWSNDNLYIGSLDTPMHLWIWRPPQHARAPAATDPQ